MLFHKFPHAPNFEFADATGDGEPLLRTSRGAVPLRLEDLGDDFFRFTAGGGDWAENESRWVPFPDDRPSGSSEVTGVLERKPLRLAFADARGRVRLESAPGRAFGVCGGAFAMGFSLGGGERFHGMGGKFLGLELSGRRTKFWNTDIMGDFPAAVYRDGRPDPGYVSIPYLAVETSGGWAGILVNNPGAVFFDTGAAMEVEGLVETSKGGRYLLLGAEHGQPDLFLFFAPTVAALTRKLHSLVGRTPLPPVWSLGYHQCRWGYRSADDLNRLRRRFREEKIPVDGLWLDIDYMREYRVFTFDGNHFPNVRADLAALQSDGQKVVPILDPGVKVDPGWEVYLDAGGKGIFCRNPQGREFVGQVWPGDTAFVDYSLPEGREWWAGRTEEFAALGLHGCWNDMNDPSVGFVDPGAMLFDRGKKEHWTHHNQFALGMAEATREGFLRARPDERPFVLSRSGSTGMGRFAALWHGDSTSNYHWLRLAIPTALNLSLSGVPFNGPDVGGFGGDAEAGFFLDSLKASFLFPFCRNHTATGTADQEPWAFGKENLSVIREYIRARYFLRPYLYQLFAGQEEAGDPVLRPLFYEFPNPPGQDFSRTEDQFLVGPALLQAPLVAGERSRLVALPPGRWWDYAAGKWIEGGGSFRVRPSKAGTPLYGRAGFAFPTAAAVPDSHRWDGRRFDLHVLLPEGREGAVSGEIVSDDGSTLAYRRGERTRLRYSAKTDGSELRISLRTAEDGYGPLSVRFVLYGEFRRVTVNRREAEVAPCEFRLAGRRQRVTRVGNKAG